MKGNPLSNDQTPSAAQLSAARSRVWHQSGSADELEAPLQALTDETEETASVPAEVEAAEASGEDRSAAKAIGDGSLPTLVPKEAVIVVEGGGSSGKGFHGLKWSFVSCDIGVVHRDEGDEDTSELAGVEVSEQDKEGKSSFDTSSGKMPGIATGSVDVLMANS